MGLSQPEQVVTLRVRALSATGDYTFGRSQGNFLIDSAAAVAQLVKTNLLLLQGEWFLDLTYGMPWFQGVLGTGTKNIYDMLIQDNVLSTPGVTKILDYSSDLQGRTLSVTMTILTQFSTATVQVTL